MLLKEKKLFPPSPYHEIFNCSYFPSRHPWWKRSYQLKFSLTAWIFLGQLDRTEAHVSRKLVPWAGRRRTHHTWPVAERKRDEHLYGAVEKYPCGSLTPRIQVSVLKTVLPMSSPFLLLSDIDLQMIAFVPSNPLLSSLNGSESGLPNDYCYSGNGEVW